jgi:hypothetical protein
MRALDTLRWQARTYTAPELSCNNNEYSNILISNRWIPQLSGHVECGKCRYNQPEATIYASRNLQVWGDITLHSMEKGFEGLSALIYRRMFMDWLKTVWGFCPKDSSTVAPIFGPEFGIDPAIAPNVFPPDCKPVLTLLKYPRKTEHILSTSCREFMDCLGL